MDRIVGIETEYGCLLSEEESHVNSELWPAKVKNYLFRKVQAGTIDLHYRDYEEPPGNGGFLLNGGRLYLDMGHIEYASPECLHLRDLVAYDLAGDELLQSSLAALGGAGRVSFIKNNVERELLDETRGAIHAADSWNAAHLSGNETNLHRRRPRWSGQSAGVRF